MSNLKFRLESDDGIQNLTVYKIPDFDNPLSADSTHSHWDQILAGVLADDVSVLDLINIAATLRREFISERVSIAAGKLFFDGDEVTDGLAEYIISLIAQGDQQYPAFINFMEKVYANPQKHSREHLFEHVKKYKMTITPEGDLVLYKGLFYNASRKLSGNARVNPYANQPQHPLCHKVYLSGSAGPAIVNGQPHLDGTVPQDIGDTVEIPRSEVSGAPGIPCSLGLHVATWGYWHTSYGPTCAVLVNPRDVVSVPHDDAKIRCCRYKIIGEVTEAYKGAVVNIKVPEAKGTSAPVVFATSEPAEKVEVVTEYKYPTQGSWNMVTTNARNRKKGIKNYLGKHTDWRLIDPTTDGKDRKHWSVI
jgi:hypothetical protein